MNLVCWQGKEAVKAEVYRKALKQSPNGFYRRQLYVLEVNLRQQQAMWVNLHHTIFHEVRVSQDCCLGCMSPSSQLLLHLYVMA